MFEKWWILVLCIQVKCVIVFNVEELEVLQILHCFGAKYKLPTVRG